MDCDSSGPDGDEIAGGEETSGAGGEEGDGTSGGEETSGAGVEEGDGTAGGDEAGAEGNCAPDTCDGDCIDGECRNSSCFDNIDCNISVGEICQNEKCLIPSCDPETCESMCFTNMVNGIQTSICGISCTSSNCIDQETGECDPYGCDGQCVLNEGV